MLLYFFFEVREQSVLFFYLYLCISSNYNSMCTKIIIIEVIYKEGCQLFYNFIGFFNSLQKKKKSYLKCVRLS